MLGFKEMDQQEVIKYANLLHFGSSRTQSPHRMYLRKEDIAKMLSVSPKQVSILLNADLSLPDYRNALKMRSSTLLSPEHVVFFPGPVILVNCERKILAEPVVLFYRRFGTLGNAV
jgi:hypothetical protein